MAAHERTPSERPHHHDKVVAIVQAGGAGGRMDVLTAERAKPALPFAGSYQLLDFALSNLVNSGVDDVWLSVQYQAESLEEQVRNGRPWDLDRTRGGLRLLVPRQGSGSLDEDGFAHGNADELFRLRDDLRRSGATTVIVTSADHVYRLDHRDLLATHEASGAELTMVVTDLAGITGEDPSDHAVVEHDADGRVHAVSYKPEEPTGTVVATEVFAYRAEVLVEVLETLHREVSGADADREAGDSGLGDFGDLLVPRLVERGHTHVHRLDGYWRDLGQPHHYLNAHLELLTEEPGLFDPTWPIRTQQPERLPAYVGPGAEVAQSLLSPGSQVAGRVVRSVVGPDAVVGAGAEVVESVLSEGVVLRGGARVVRAVVDAGAEVGPTGRVGGPGTDVSDPDAVALVGRDARVDGEVGPGARVPPGATA
ncbi:glucose-1-phosphate adenylyltransferase family protein [Nocardioides marmoraquaticus]